MDGKRILPIILNYNQPEETDKIYEKLSSDGFKDIISVDNGSDIMPRAKSANFVLPKNIKSVGQTKMALIYAMDYLPADYYWIINTSAELVENINYKQHIKNSLTSLAYEKLSAGIISPSLISAEATPHQQYTKNSTEDYNFCCWCECIAPIISHELLEKNRRNSTGFFHPNAKRGWITSHEMGYEAFNNKLYWILDNKMPVKWDKNKGFRKHANGESLNNYREKAALEMKGILNAKLGFFWRIKLYANFLKFIKEAEKEFKGFKELRKSALSFGIKPFDPFGAWKLFFIRLNSGKLIKTPFYFII